MGQSGSIVQVNHGYARNFLVPNKIATFQRGKQSGSIAPGVRPVFQSQHESLVKQQEQQQGTLSSQEEDAKQVENIQKAIKKLTSSTLVRSLFCLDTQKVVWLSLSNLSMYAFCFAILLLVFVDDQAQGVGHWSS